METGYYISAYVHIDPLANLEQIQVRHDQTVALWYLNNGNLTLVHYWELERLTGLKKHNVSFYDSGHFQEILCKLLAEYHLALDDVKEIWGVPQFMKENGMSGRIEGIYYHNTAHIYSVLLKDTERFNKDNFLILAVDGGPDVILDKKNDKPFCACYSKEGNILAWEPIASPAPLWSIASALFNLEEGTLMALMSGCNCCPEGMDVKDYWVDSMRSALYAKRDLEQLAGEVFSIAFNEENKRKFGYDERFTEQENCISMFMKLIQKISNRIMEKNIEILIDKLRIDVSNTYLSVVGGYALNCPSNSYLVNKYRFKAFYEIPCVSDTGIALGYGLGEFYARNRKIRFCLKNAFWGNGISIIDMDKAVGSYVERVETADEVIFAEDLEKGPLVWVCGRSEVGPRALGHRSILADPRNHESKRRLNEIKKRQWWRPVAPIILKECIGDWFINGEESEYMLRTFFVLPDKKDLVPAVLHLDNSARVQTITKEGDYFLYKCIQKFYQVTGVPMVCNTSLNDKGEPIIDTLEGVFEFAKKKGLSVVYVNGVRIQLKEGDNFMREASLSTRRIDYAAYTKTLDKEAERNRLNPYHVSHDGLEMYYARMYSAYKYSLLEEQTVKTIKKLRHLQDVILS